MSSVKDQKQPKWPAVTDWPIFKMEHYAALINKVVLPVLTQILWVTLSEISKEQDSVHYAIIVQRVCVLGSVCYMYICL